MTLYARMSVAVAYSVVFQPTFTAIPRKLQKDCYLFTLGTVTDQVYYSGFHISMDFMEDGVTAAFNLKIPYIHSMEFDDKTQRLFYTTYPLGRTHIQRSTIYYIKVNSDGSTTNPLPFHTDNRRLDFVGDVAIEHRNRRLYYLSSRSIQSLNLDGEPVMSTVHVESPIDFLAPSDYRGKTLDFAVQWEGRYAFIASEHGTNGFKIHRHDLTDRYGGKVDQLITRNARPFCGMAIETITGLGQTVEGSYIYFCNLVGNKDVKEIKIYRSHKFLNGKIYQLGNDIETQHTLLHAETPTTRNKPVAMVASKRHLYAAVYFPLKKHGQYGELWKINKMGTKGIQKIAVEFSVFEDMQLRAIASSCDYMELLCPWETQNIRINKRNCLRTTESTCAYRCSKTAKKAKAMAECQDGFWMNERALCTTVCPRAIGNDVTLSDGCRYLTDNVCSFVCAKGLRTLTAHNSITCLNGHWSTPLNELCSDLCPTVIYHGLIEESCSREQGISCGFRCDEGFDPTHSSVTCGSESHWIKAESDFCYRKIISWVNVVVPILFVLAAGIVLAVIIWYVKSRAKHLKEVTKHMRGSGPDVGVIVPYVGHLRSDSKGHFNTKRLPMALVKQKEHMQALKGDPVVNVTAAPSESFEPTTNCEPSESAGTKATGVIDRDSLETVERQASKNAPSSDSFSIDSGVTCQKTDGKSKRRSNKPRHSKRVKPVKK